jgi:hypothetical protein
MSFLRSERASRLECWLERCGLVAFLLGSLLLAAISSFAQSPPKKDFADKDQLTKRLLALDLPAKDPPALPANVIVEKLMAASARRSAQLRGFEGTRFYRLQYHGFLGTREATMQVLVTFTAPDRRDFSVISQTGSKLLLNRVLLKLLDSEREAYRNQSQIELSPANYEFDFIGIEKNGNDSCYVLGVRPRKENKFLYRGKIWIDARDFAVVRMQGQPAKSPSFWIRDTQIDTNWAKVDDFWLIQHNHSASHIRMGGMADLNIDYSDYQITGVGLGAKGRSQNPQLPDPSSVTPQR